MTVPGDGSRASHEAPTSVRLAGLVLVVEAAGLVLLGAVDLAKVVTGSPRSTVFAVVAAGLAVGTAGVLLLLSRALRRLRGWAYTPTIVLQLLALPVGYSLAVQAGLWAYGGPVLLLALGELAALIAPSSRRTLGPG